MADKIDIEAFRHYLASAYAATKICRHIDSTSAEYDPINSPNRVPIWHEAICSAQNMYMIEKVFANKDVDEWNTFGVREHYGFNSFSGLDSLYEQEMEKTND